MNVRHRKPEAGKVTPAALAERIALLRREAELDGIVFSEASLADSSVLMRELGPRVRPSLFLNDNGNLRALWRNDSGEQVGLQCLGDGTTQFVIFSLRWGAPRMARVAGVDGNDKLLGHITASGAEALLFA